MRSVVIITRSEAYKTGKASDITTNMVATEGNRKIHDYVSESLASAFKDEDKSRFNKLTTKASALMGKLHEIAEKRGKSSKEDYTSNDQTDELTADESDDDFKNNNETLLKECKPILDEILRDADKNPYVCFPYKYGGEDIKVCFVFLDNILGAFVMYPNEYQNFLNGKKLDERLEFIKAICEDCEIMKDEGNILYIHDKEWYDSNEEKEKLVLYEGEWDPEYKGKEYATELKAYFKTIQVFTHNSPSFERIKELEFIFPEKDMELKIERRKYF